jgi:hypothetical protein
MRAGQIKACAESVSGCKEWPVKNRTVKLLGVTYRIKDKWFALEKLGGGRWWFAREIPYSRRHREINEANCKCRIVEYMELVRIVATKEFK